MGPIDEREPKYNWQEGEIMVPKKLPAQSGIFNARVLVGFALFSVGALMAMLSVAATPFSGITTSANRSPGESVFAGKHAGQLSGKTTLGATSLPLAPAAGSWTVVSSPNTSTTQNNLLGVTRVSAPDCWAVGFYVASSGAPQTLVEHWDGIAWAAVPSPNASRYNNVLSDVTCVSASNCWAVGFYVSGPSVYQTLIERWDGTSWTIVTSPNAAQINLLNSATCVSASDCWAVGYSEIVGVGTLNIDQTLIEHWNGTSWTIVTSPNATAWAKNFLYGVTCVSASNCWAVGFSQSIVGAYNINRTLIERWDGTSWAIVNSANTSALDNYLDGVTCASASDCWAVGYYFTGNAVQNGVYQNLIERWDGTSWAIVNSPNTSTTEYNHLFGVTCASASECWAVGLSGTSLGQTLIERWDGSSWAIVNSPNTSATLSNFLYGVTCASASDCWAVGYYYNGSVSLTLTEHYTIPVVQLVSVVSRKVHGSAGTFDINLPPTGTRGVECRSGGTNGDYTLVFSFANTLTSVASANVSGMGSVSSSTIDNNDPHNYIVNLTGVTNAQVITVSLTNVTDSVGNFSSAVPASMGVLVGDVDASGRVDSTDVFQVRQQTLQITNSSNFRMDIDESGRIDSTDVFIVRQQTLTALP